jgi:uncharacterized BrkB/YihY/UPF0761 family membrane protein
MLTDILLWVLAIVAIATALFGVFWILCLLVVAAVGLIDRIRSVANKIFHRKKNRRKDEDT